MVVKQLPFVQGVFVRLPEFAGGCRPIIPRPEPGGGAEIRIEGRELDGALHGATFVVFDRHHEIVKFIQVTDEAYSVAGEMGFGWWLVEHYLPYHVNRPNGCDSGEPTRGR